MVTMKIKCDMLKKSKFAYKFERRAQEVDRLRWLWKWIEIDGFKYLYDLINKITVASRKINETKCSWMKRWKTSVFYTAIHVLELSWKSILDDCGTTSTDVVIYGMEDGIFDRKM